METRSMTTLEAQNHPSRTASPCRRRLISLGVLALVASLQAQAQETAGGPAAPKTWSSPAFAPA